LWLNIKKQLLQDEVGDFVKLKIIEISSRSKFDVEKIEVDKNHIHILLTISLTICAASYVRRIKQSTTKSLWRKFSWLKKPFLLEKTFFSDGYFVCSVVNASAETVRKYIQEQG
jgi:putative transposase